MGQGLVRILRRSTPPCADGARVMRTLPPGRRRTSCSWPSSGDADLPLSSRRWPGCSCSSSFGPQRPTFDRTRRRADLGRSAVRFGPRVPAGSHLGLPGRSRLPDGRRDVGPSPSACRRGVLPTGKSGRASSRRGICEAVEEAARDLLGSGMTVIPTSFGNLQARLVRFWTGTAVLDCQLPAIGDMNGRAFTLVDRRELKQMPPVGLERTLLSNILSQGRNAHPDLWGSSPPESERVPSPGGWVSPSGVQPGWNWVPPGGAVPRVDLIPRWVSGTTRHSSTGSLTLGCGDVAVGKSSRRQSPGELIDFLADRRS